MKQEEMNFDKQILQVNPETLQVVSQAQKDGKRVVVIADTYYPKSFVEKLLKDRNISV